MPRYALHRAPAAAKWHYVELIRDGVRGAEAARRISVSTRQSVASARLGLVSFLIVARKVATQVS